jgi:hypothetical protein
VTQFECNSLHLFIGLIAYAQRTIKLGILPCDVFQSFIKSGLFWVVNNEMGDFCRVIDVTNCVMFTLQLSLL